jgi:hypothetical protein
MVATQDGLDFGGAYLDIALPASSFESCGDLRQA